MAAGIAEGLTRISHAMGSGDLVADLMLLSLGLSLAALIFGLAVYRRSGNQKLHPAIERLSNLGGRIEKMDKNMADLRTDVMRANEIMKGDLGFLKVEVEYMRRLLEERGGGGGSEEGGPSGEEQGGSEGEGGAQTRGHDVRTFTAQYDAPAAAEPEPIDYPEVDEPVTEVPVEKESTSLFSRLAGTRRGFLGKIKNLFGVRTALDAASLEELEEILITSDIGVSTTQQLIAALQREVAARGTLDQPQLIAALQEEISAILEKDASSDPAIHPAKREDGPLVVMLVGVNGAGKTTTAAKLAHQFKAEGASVMLCAADTFRAGAVDQLVEWGDRLGVHVVKGAENAKPATVVYDAMVEAKRENVDVLLIDTAGRLHTKSNLMQELEGVRNNISRHQPSAPHEVLLVVDGASGQNALQQAREFHGAVQLTGVIITKLDGTPKGGVVVGIKSELGLPIRYIGVGEKREDLRPFAPREFAAAICDTTEREPSDSGVAESAAHGALH